MLKDLERLEAPEKSKALVTSMDLVMVATENSPAPKPDSSPMKTAESELANPFRDNKFHSISNLPR